MTTFVLLTCALTLAQPPNQVAEWQLIPQFAQGMELVYKGTCTEESLVPGVNHHKQYLLETVLFVHQVGPRFCEAALQTSVTAKPPKGADARNPPAPGSVRLEKVKLDLHGRLHAEPGTSLLIPLHGPPLLETGAFLELPAARVNLQSYWEATEEGRPLRSWNVVGIDQHNGLACLKLQGNQQSLDWTEPRADSTAWRRKDILWFSPQLGLVCRVERTIERREPAREAPTHRLVVAYDLESRLRFPGKLFEDRKDEILRADKFLDDAAPLLRQPAQYRNQIDSLQRRIIATLEGRSPTPFRKTITHLQQRLESARRGEVPLALAAEDKTALQVPLKIGQKVPDFVVTDLTSQKSRRFHQYLGQPILVLYYNPTSATGREALRFAQQLYDRYGTDLLILGMAVSDDVDLIRRQHEEMTLAYSILDGRAMHQTFGVDGTPRFVLLDGAGVMRCGLTGWGYQTPGDIVNEVGAALSDRPSAIGQK